MNEENILARRVKELRLKNRMTQPQLGDAVGLSKQAINDIEQGRRETKISKAILMARLFDTTVEYLCGDTDDPTRPTEVPFVESLFSDDSKLPFSIRLKGLQAEKKVAWEEIADFLESVEDKTALSCLIALADYFDVSLDYLVGRSDDPTRR